MSTYDANGNTTLVQANKTLEYDWANRLVKVRLSGSVKLEYYYDAANRLTRDTDALGHTRQTGYDEADRV